MLRLLMEYAEQAFLLVWRAGKRGHPVSGRADGIAQRLFVNWLLGQDDGLVFRVRRGHFFLPGTPGARRR